MTVSSRPVGNRKRKKSIEQLDHMISVIWLFNAPYDISALLLLQQEILCKQMEVLSAQLQLIEEQRANYRLKKQRPLEKDQC